MARLSEFEKRRLAKYYCCCLLNLYETGKIDENQMEVVITDILILKKLLVSFEWKKLSSDQKLNVISQYLKKPTDFFSPLTLAWIKLHLAHEERQTDDKVDKLTKMILKMDHFPVLERSVREVEKHIITVFVEVPDYIEVTEERQKKIKQIFKVLLTTDALTAAQKREIWAILGNLNFKVSDGTYKKITDQYFNLQKSCYVKVFISVSKSNRDSSVTGIDIDDEYKNFATHLFDYKLNLFRKNVLRKKID
jgi:hypothetical protein